MVEGSTIRSKKQPSIFFFFHRLVLFITCLCRALRELIFKSVLIVYIAYFFTIFVRKYLHILIDQRKR